MKQKIVHKSRWLYGFLALFTMLSYNNYAQSVKRQCIASYGSVVLTNDLTISQTAGQCYNTIGSIENEAVILPGFQQTTTFSVKEISSQPMKNLNLKVYPNPASYSIAINSDEDINQYSIQIVDINGKHVFSEKVSSMPLQTINCESWINGVYLIKIYDSMQNIKTLRLIISK